MTLFKINAVFDVNCPWCYLGHTYLSRAMASRKSLYPQDTFKISLSPFYLKPPPQTTDPSAPLFPVPTQSRQKLREETYGKVYAESVLDNIKRAAKGAGLKLKYNGLTGTTRNAHRLIQHAQQIGGDEKAESTLHSLFKLYHEQEFDITQLSVLSEVGAKNGLGSNEEVKQYLLSGEDGEMVDEMAEEARRSHAGGVPWFEVYNGKDEQRSLQINGAQSEDAWQNIFEKVARS